MKRLIAGIAFSLFIGSSLWAFQGRYQIKAKFIPPDKILASQNLDIFNDTSGEFTELYFRIYPNRRLTPKEKKIANMVSSYFKTDFFPQGYSEGYLKIRNITCEGKNLRFSYADKEHTILKVELPSMFKPKERLNLNISFEVKVPLRRGSFGYYKNTVSLYYWYPILAVYKDGKWNLPFYYIFHQPYFSDAFNYKVEIELPSSWKVFSSGEVVFQKNNSTVLETERPIRDFGMVIFKGLKIAEDTWNNKVRIRFSYPRQFSDRDAREIISYIKSAFDFYSKNFGQYPYSHFDASSVNLGYAGNESSCLIMLDERLMGLPRELRRYKEMLVVHETGHQWFYNLVGNNQFKEAFLDEGLNSFSVYLYMQDKYGPDAQVLELPRYLDFFLPNFTFLRASIERYLFLLRNGMDGRILSPLSSMREPQSVFAINYSKSQDVLYMLYSLLGRKVFLKSLNEYVKEFIFKNASVEDLRMILEKVSGKDLKDFFKGWLETKNFVDYYPKKVCRGKFRIKNKGRNFVPFKAKVDDKEIFVGNPQDLGATFGVKHSLIIDPRFKVVEKDKVNNCYPRRIKYRWVNLYLPLYERGFFQDPYSYNFIFGPYIDGGLGYKMMFSYPYRWHIYASHTYDFSSQQNFKTGLVVKNLFDKPLDVGAEFMRRLEDSEEEGNLSSWHMFFNWSLNPLSSSVFWPQDKVVFYILHNKRPDFLSLQDILAFNHYFRDEESIFGGVVFLNRLQPYPFPVEGFSFFFNVETAFSGWRSSRDYTRLLLGARFNRSILKKKIVLSWRFQAGHSFRKMWAFSLGGPGGMRGFRLKSLKGSKFIFFSQDTFFVLSKDMRLPLLGRYLYLDGLYLDVFFDAAKYGYEDFSGQCSCKDAGLGIDLEMSLFSFVEKFLLRVECSSPINGDNRTPRFNIRVKFPF